MNLSAASGDAPTPPGMFSKLVKSNKNILVLLDSSSNTTYQYPILIFDNMRLDGGGVMESLAMRYMFTLHLSGREMDCQ